MDLNKVMIIGNATRDPEVKMTPSGISVASFGVATNLVWTDQAGQKQQKVEFHNVVAWRRLAEICGQYLKKGNKVYIEGRLETREWVGQQDGIKRYRTEIVADNMILLERMPVNNNGAYAGSAPFQGVQVRPQMNNYSSPQVNNYAVQNNPPIISIDEPVSQPIDQGFANIQEENSFQEDEIKIENIPF